MSLVILNGRRPADFVPDGDEGLRGEEGSNVDVEPLLKTSLVRFPGCFEL
jgi:hypothetical protein